MAEKKKFEDPIFQARTRKAFFEIYDSLAIDKVRVQITQYDPETNKRTHSAQYYLDYQVFLGLSAVVTNGKIDEFISKEAAKSFPRYAHSEGKVQRSWTMEKTDKGFYKINIIEKEKGDKWEDAKLVDEAAFFINSFDLYACSETVAQYILSKRFIARELGNSPDRVGRVEEETPDSDDFHME